VSLTVVVATHNRSERLVRLLAALDKQDLPDLEVVVVDDGSSDDTWNVLQEATRRYPWLQAHQMARNGGPARARNAGWRTSRRDIVAFTDDDCVPSPEWATRLLGAFETAGTDIAQGATSADQECFRVRGPFAHSVRVEQASPMFETCNLAVRRALLERLDGFDESFAHAYGEDCDLGWRAKALGATAVFLPDAVVVHDVVERTFLQQLRAERRRTSLVTVVRLHPGLRRYLWRRLFYDPTHARLVTAFALTAVAAQKPSSPARWTAALAAFGYYGRLRFLWSITRGPRKLWPVWMAQLFVLDAVDIARLAKASAHEKTLVL
jgi:GT2 family glycosyltransferase